MEVTSVSVIIDEKRKVLEDLLKKSALVDDFDMEDLDKRDERKDVMIVFKDPVDAHYVGQELIRIFGEKKMKSLGEEE